MSIDLGKMRKYFAYIKFSYITVENTLGGHKDSFIVKDIHCQELN